MRFPGQLNHFFHHMRFSSSFKNLFLAIMLVAIVLASSSVCAAAPAFQLREEYNQVKLSDYKGKLIYLDFWATWCAPCRYSFPWMEQMQQKYGEMGFEVIAVSLDGKRDVIERFLKQQQVSFTVVQDNHMKTANAYGVSAMPSSFLIDGNGEIVFKHFGFNNTHKSILEQKIRELLLN